LSGNAIPAPLSQPPIHQAAAYLAEYCERIAGIGMSPEQMAGVYSTALRLTPARVRIY
jgi:hypothetical protein